MPFTRLREKRAVNANCMRKYMGTPDHGGPASGDGLVPQDILDELKRRGLAPRLSPTPTDADRVDGDDEKETGSPP
jgi:hypothetical protein